MPVTKLFQLIIILISRPTRVMSIYWCTSEPTTEIKSCRTLALVTTSWGDKILYSVTATLQGIPHIQTVQYLDLKCFFDRTKLRRVKLLRLPDIYHCSVKHCSITKLFSRLHINCRCDFFPLLSISQSHLRESGFTYTVLYIINTL